MHPSQGNEGSAPRGRLAALAIAVAGLTLGLAGACNPKNGGAPATPRDPGPSNMARQGGASGGNGTGGSGGNEATGGSGPNVGGSGGAGGAGMGSGGTSPPAPDPDATAPEPVRPPAAEAGAERGPATDPAGPMVVAAAGDIAAAADGNEKTTATLLHKINGETPLKAIFMLGDGAYRFARLAEYRRLYEPTWGVPALKAITYPIPGNHEYLENPSGGGYFDYWNGVGQMNGRAGERGKGYYSFDLGGWHVVALNSNEDCRHVACGEGSAQLAWLKADLAAHPVLCTIGIVHHPRFQNGTHRGDTPALQPAWAAMYDAGVDVVLAAHEHNYQQFAPMDKTGKLDMARGIRSFVVGTGGGRDFREVFSTAHMATEEKRIVNQSGVMFLTLNVGSYSFRWLHTDGRVGASGNGVCH